MSVQGGGVVCGPAEGAVDEAGEEEAATSAAGVGEIL